MKKIFFFILLGIILIGNISIVYADFVDISDPLEGTYFFEGKDVADRTFKVQVEFDLWKDVSLGLYQYRYQVINLADEANAEVEDIAIFHLADITNQGVIDVGNKGPDYWRDKNSIAEYKWRDLGLEENETSNWFWLTSSGKPGLLNASVYGSGGSYAQEKIPTPVPTPEPYSFIIIGIGLILFFYKKQIFV